MPKPKKIWRKILILIFAVFVSIAAFSIYKNHLHRTVSIYFTGIREYFVGFGPAVQPVDYSNVDWQSCKKPDIKKTVIPDDPTEAAILDKLVRNGGFVFSGAIENAPYDMKNSGKYVCPYFDFLEKKHVPHDSPSQKEIKKMFFIRRHKKNGNADKPPENSDLLKTLKIDFAIDKFSPDKIRIYSGKEIEPKNLPGINEMTFYFDDPYLGIVEFKVFRKRDIEPGDEIGPVIVGLHGHCENAHSFIELHGLSELIEHGFTMVVPNFTAMCGPPDESIVSKSLYMAGFSFQGLQVYEAFVALKIAEALGGGSPAGLIGHSAGSSTGNLTTRIFPDSIACYVSDSMTDYFNAEADYNGEFTNDFAPQIFMQFGDINKYPYKGVEVLKAPYGYGADGSNSEIGRIDKFFGKCLVNRK